MISIGHDEHIPPGHGGKAYLGQVTGFLPRKAYDGHCAPDSAARPSVPRSLVPSASVARSAPPCRLLRSPGRAQEKIRKSAWIMSEEKGFGRKSLNFSANHPMMEETKGKSSRRRVRDALAGSNELQSEGTVERIEQWVFDCAFFFADGHVGRMQRQWPRNGRYTTQKLILAPPGKRRQVRTPLSFGPVS